MKFLGSNEASIQSWYLGWILRGRQRARKAQRLLWAPQGPPPASAAVRCTQNNVKPSITGEPAPLAGAKRVGLPPVQLSLNGPPHKVLLCSRFEAAFHLDAWTACLAFPQQQLCSSPMWTSLLWTLVLLTKFWVCTKRASFSDPSLLASPGDP